MAMLGVRSRTIVGAVLLLAGCQAPPPADRVIYLLDLGGSTGDERRIVMRDDQRPAFALGSTLEDAEPTTIAAGSGVVPASREVVVAVEREGAGSQGGLRAVRAVVVVGDALRTEYPTLAPGASDVRLGFMAEEVGRAYRYAVTATSMGRAASSRRAFRPVMVPAGATFAVAFGVREALCTTLPVMEVSVMAIARGRTTEVLHTTVDPRRSCDEWFEVRAPLHGLGGERVRFRFEAKPAGRESSGRGIELVVADPMIVPPEGRSMRRPNLVLVSLDTLAAGHLGLYGHASPTSPTLDRLAREGTVYERAIAHYPSTTASHMTMLTGLLPQTHAVRGVLDRLAPDVPLLAEILRRERFLTAAITEDGALLASMGFARGFHTYREQHRRGDGRSSHRTIELATEWLRTMPPEPFFLFLHTYETHEPYDPPARYLRAVRRDGDVANADPAWRYDAEIRLLDDALGRLLATLADRSVLDRSILVVTSDHGEAFGEHGEWRHGSMLYDEVMHVPLIVRGPGVPRDHRVVVPAGLVDVVPTVLDLLAVDVPVGLHGRSVAPESHPEGDHPPLVAELRGGIGPRGEDRARDLRAVWLGRHKAILDVRRRRWRVFDLEKDPGESRDLASRAPAVTAAAAKVLAAYDALPIAGGVPGSPVGSGAPDVGAVDRLRALGYVE